MAWFMMGEIEQESGRINEAIEAYSTAETLQPNDIGSLGRLADLHFERGSYLDSIAIYDRLLNLDSPPDWVYVGAGKVYENLGLSTLAFVLFLYAIEESQNTSVELFLRVLRIFSQLSDEVKKKYAFTTALFIDQFIAIDQLSSSQASQLKATRKMCQALVPNELNRYKKSADTIAANKRRLTKLDTRSSAWEAIIESEILNKLKFVITGIHNGCLNAALSGWSGDVLSAQLNIDGENFGKLNFSKNLNGKFGSSTLTAIFSLPPQFIDARPHVYFITLELGRLRLQSEPETLLYPDYRFQIDSADFATINGWAFKSDSLNPLTLRAVLEQGAECVVETELPRQDVQLDFPKAPQNSGFMIRIPECNSIGYIVNIYDQETGIQLSRLQVCQPYTLMRQAVGEWAQSYGLAQRMLLNGIAPKLFNSSLKNVELYNEFIPAQYLAVDHVEIAVIIPVYEGLGATIECIESVLASRNQTLSRIIIVNDSTPNAGIQAYLKALELKEIENLVVIHRHRNGGFSGAVNTGILIAGTRDVILLNADTVVQHGWIDRLAAAAQSDQQIGTVTPLSNNAEICTVPYSCKSLPIDDPNLAFEVDETAALVNIGQLVDIPVAIGFCMYIKHRCIQDVGLFDAATWGRGYGEEVDFCLKAAAKGWRHIMTGNTFVVHRGNVSFGDEKLRRIQESAKKISERYPFYDSLIQQFLARDPTNAARRNLNLGLIHKALAPKRILHVTHNYGGGTEQYLKDQCTFNRADGCVNIILRFGDAGQSKLNIDLSDTRIAGFFAESHEERYTANEVEVLKADLGSLGIERLHLHSPYGMPMPFLEWLVTSFPTTVTIHDYAWICPRVTLTQAAGRYCEEPGVEQCNRCISIYGSHQGLRNFVKDSKNDVAIYRQAFGNILAKAELVISGAKDVISRMQKHGIKANYKVVPYLHPQGSVFLKKVIINPEPPKKGIVRVALIGGISEIKGFHQLVECAEVAEKKRLPIEFVVFGTTHDDRLLEGLSNVRVLGSYKEDELEDLMLMHKPNVAFFPNQWPETYSFTLTHALRFGLFTIVTNIGAPAERVANLKNAISIPLTMSALDICETIIMSSMVV